MKTNTASTITPSTNPVATPKPFAVKTNLRAGIAGRTRGSSGQNDGSVSQSGGA